MYDKDLTRMICDLSCTKNDVAVNQTTVKYDTDHPFKKYYSLSTLKGAIEKYLSREWDDTTLAGWACLYCWILSGGFDDNLKEDLNSFESFFKDLLTWNLDGLSFFSEEYWDEEMLSISKKTELYENYDRIWQTRDKIKVVYASIDTDEEQSGYQCALLINGTDREYMIMIDDHINNGFKDACFTPVTLDEYVATVNKLRNEGYKLLKCDEEYYYAEIADQDK